MAASVVATNSNSSINSTSLSIDAPTGTSSGDLLVAVVANDENGGSFRWQAVSGWTLETKQSSGIADTETAIYWRVATGDSNDNAVFPCSVSLDLIGVVLRIADARLLGQPDGQGSWVIDGDLNTNISVTGYTTTRASLVITAVSGDGGDTSPFSLSGWTEHFDDGVNSTNGAGLAVYSKSVAASTASGTASITASSGDGFMGVQIGFADAIPGELFGNSDGASTVTGELSIKKFHPLYESHTENNGNTSITLTKPSGISVGDGLLMIVVDDESSETDGWNTPTGWTKEVDAAGNNISDSRITVYSRIADGTEGANESMSSTDGFVNSYGWYIHMTGTSESNMIRVIGAETINSSTSIAPSTPTDNEFGNVAHRAYLAIFAGDANTTSGSRTFTISTADGWDGPSDEREGAINLIGGWVFSYRWQDAPNSGPTFSTSVSDGNVAIVIGIASSQPEVLAAGSTTVAGDLSQIVYHPVLEGSNKNEAGSGNLTLTKPSGVTAGDLLVMVVMDNETSETNGWTTPSGWTQTIDAVGNSTSDSRITMYERIATGTEGASENITSADGFGHCVGWYQRWSGAAGTETVRAVGTETINSSTGITPTTPSLPRSQQRGHMAYMALAAGDNVTTQRTITVSSDWQDEYGEEEDTGFALSAAYGVKYTYNTQPGNPTFSFGKTDGNVAIVVAIAPGTLQEGWAEGVATVTGDLSNDQNSPVLETWTENTNTNTASTSITMTKPSGVQNNDLLLLVMNDNRTGTADPWTTTPTGWTKEFTAGDGTSDSGYTVFSRVADGTEGATIGVSHSSSRTVGGWYMRISGVDDTAPFDNNSTWNSSTALSITADGVTPSTASKHYLNFGIASRDNTGSGTTGYPSGWDTTKRDVLTASGHKAMFATRTWYGNSTTLNATFTMDNSSTDGMGALQFLVLGGKPTNNCAAAPAGVTTVTGDLTSTAFLDASSAGVGAALTARLDPIFTPTAITGSAVVSDAILSAFVALPGQTMPAVLPHTLPLPEFSNDRPVSGAVAGVASVTGSLTQTYQLEGSAAGVGAVTAFAIEFERLFGVVNASSTASAALKQAVKPTATVAGVGSVTGDLTQSQALSGTSDGTATVTGEIDVTRNLTVTVTGTSTVAGDPDLIVNIDGASDGSSTVLGNMDAYLFSDVAGTANTAATITTEVFLQTGGSAGFGSVTGDLESIAFLSTQSDGAATVSAFALELEALNGAIAGTSTATGSLFQSQNLAATSDGTSTASATLSRSVNLFVLSAGNTTLIPDPTNATLVPLTPTANVAVTGWTAVGAATVWQSVESDDASYAEPVSA